jgi:hypothetical protein
MKNMTGFSYIFQTKYLPRPGRQFLPLALKTQYRKLFQMKVSSCFFSEVAKKLTIRE